jgi:hypothetical protein
MSLSEPLGDMLARIRNAQSARHAAAIRPTSKRDAAAVPRPGKVFGVLTMPNGQQIRTMREDAFLAALTGTRDDTHGVATEDKIKATD